MKASPHLSSSSVNSSKEVSDGPYNDGSSHRAELFYSIAESQVNLFSVSQKVKCVERTGPGPIPTVVFSGYVCTTVLVQVSNVLAPKERGVQTGLLLNEIEPEVDL